MPPEKLTYPMSCHRLVLGMHICINEFEIFGKHTAVLSVVHMDR